MQACMNMHAYVPHTCMICMRMYHTGGTPSNNKRMAWSAHTYTSTHAHPPPHPHHTANCSNKDLDIPWGVDPVFNHPSFTTVIFDNGISGIRQGILDPACRDLGIQWKPEWSTEQMLNQGVFMCTYVYQGVCVVWEKSCAGKRAKSACIAFLVAVHPNAPTFPLSLPFFFLSFFALPHHLHPKHTIFPHHQNTPVVVY